MRTYEYFFMSTNSTYAFAYTYQTIYEMHKERETILLY